MLCGAEYGNNTDVPELNLWRDVLRTAIEDCLLVTQEKRLHYPNDFKIKLTPGELLFKAQSRLYFEEEGKEHLLYLADKCGISYDYIIRETWKLINEQDKRMSIYVYLPHGYLLNSPYAAKIELVYQKAKKIIQKWNDRGWCKVYATTPNRNWQVFTS